MSKTNRTKFTITDNQDILTSPSKTNRTKFTITDINPYEFRDIYEQKIRKEFWDNLLNKIEKLGGKLQKKKQLKLPKKTKKTKTNTKKSTKTNKTTTKGIK
jgi:hypothetical protein